jgi:hypothetical protein
MQRLVGGWSTGDECVFSAGVSVILRSAPSARVCRSPRRRCRGGAARRCARCSRRGPSCTTPLSPLTPLLLCPRRRAHRRASSLCRTTSGPWTSSWAVSAAAGAGSQPAAPPPPPRRRAVVRQRRHCRTLTFLWAVSVRCRRGTRTALSSCAPARGLSLAAEHACGHRLSRRQQRPPWSRSTARWRRTRHGCRSCSARRRRRGAGARHRHRRWSSLRWPCFRRHRSALRHHRRRRRRPRDHRRHRRPRPSSRHRGPRRGKLLRGEVARVQQQLEARPQRRRRRRRRARLRAMPPMRRHQQLLRLLLRLMLLLLLLRQPLPRTGPSALRWCRTRVRRRRRDCAGCGYAPQRACVCEGARV